MTDDIPFIKYHGLGNDFIIIDATARPDLASLPWSSLAPLWCDRHRGIGADGILLLTEDDQSPAPADLRMQIINSDGSLAQMCGNGIRCVAKYMIEHRSWPRGTLRILTGNGILDISAECSALAGSRIVERVTVNMGMPRLAPREIPVRSPLDRILNVPLSQLAEDQDRSLVAAISAELAPFTAPSSPTICAVSMGNPHAVLFVHDVARIPLESLGPRIEHRSAFPQRINVHFVEVTSRTTAIMRTWERGAGPTSACGTGACAVLAAGALTDRLDDQATLSVPGGDLLISWQRESTSRRTAGVYKTGPATEVYRGTIAGPALLTPSATGTTP